MGGDGGHFLQRTVLELLSDFWCKTTLICADNIESAVSRAGHSLAFLLDALNFTFDEDSSDKHTFLLITLHYPTSSPLDAEIVFLCLFNISAVFQTPSCHFLVVTVVSVTSVRL
ncbi:hypothetical protein BLNAU_15826 [Blattamonas nauphoetae]|uniref:Uncharacterized protein n=1 Tax=Blattamonas nauphoetae TaxID=2049346 RepID=A0ABQ9X9L0_9EUKA|nr:hypothetical protein BLNAU_15826 [Blattamonas nauphoetae]